MIEGHTPESGPQEVEISPAKPEDARALQEVFYQTWLATYPNEEEGITEEDVEDRYKDRNSEEKTKEREKRIQDLPSTTKYFVARQGEKIIGLCLAEKQEGCNQLKAIYVLPEFQGKGLGSKLWKEAKDFLGSTEDTFVEVAKYNKNAIDFYSRLGFEPTGRELKDERFRLKSGAIITEIEMILKKIKE